MPIPDYDNSPKTIKFLAYKPKDTSDSELLDLAEEMQFTCRVKSCACL